jgi:hypothetical protein
MQDLHISPCPYVSKAIFLNALQKTGKHKEKKKKKALLLPVYKATRLQWVCSFSS